MKNSATKFEIEVNGKLFSEATVSIEDQLEVNLVTLPGVDSAVLAVTAFIPEAPRGGNYTRTQNLVLNPGDSVTVRMTATKGGTTTLVHQGNNSMEKEDPASEPAMKCSFCDKSNHEVAKMISGGSLFICDECVHMFQEIVDDDGR